LSDFDRIAWKPIHDRLKMVLAKAKGFRSLNYQQLSEKLAAGVELELCGPTSCTRSTFTSMGPSLLPATGVAKPWLAGDSGRCGGAIERGVPLSKPAWVDEPRFTLTSPWNRWKLTEDFDAALAEVEESFRKRNVLFEARDLIAL